VAAFHLLLTSDLGLLSLGVILLVVVMALYLARHFGKPMKSEPGQEGWV